MNTFFKISFMMILLLFSVSSYAQSPQSWIEIDGSHEVVTNGQNKVLNGFLGGFDLKELVKDNPVSLSFAEKHAAYDVYAQWSYWAGLLPFAALFGGSIGVKETELTLISAVGFIGSSFLMSHSMRNKKPHCHAYRLR
jgi:hypothetical protein